MRFTATAVCGAFVIDCEPDADSRGLFARTFCRREFEAMGLRTDFVQCGLVLNREAGTLRGLHYQTKPFEETKLIRCARGSIYDVILDLRPDSATFRAWLAVELSAAQYRMLYVPDGVAHGYETLEANSEVFYQFSQFYEPSAATGVRWDDPAFSISWPHEPTVVSARDGDFPDYVR